MLGFFDTIKISKPHFNSGKISDFSNKIIKSFNEYLLHLGGVGGTNLQISRVWNEESADRALK